MVLGHPSDEMCNTSLIHADRHQIVGRGIMKGICQAKDVILQLNLNDN